MKHYGDHEGLSSFVLAVVLGLGFWMTVWNTPVNDQPAKVIADRSMTTFPDSLKGYNE